MLADSADSIAESLELLDNFTVAGCMRNTRLSGRPVSQPRAKSVRLHGKRLASESNGAHERQLVYTASARYDLASFAELSAS